MGRISLLLTVALLGCCALTGCSSDEPSFGDPLPPNPVRLDSTPAIQTTGLTIGILMGPHHGPGSEYRGPAHGAQVAAYRFAQGGLTINFKVVVDNGTSQGALTSMQELIDSKVEGIIVAGEGPHLTEALLLAERTKTPTLLPFDYINSVSAPVYHLGPDRASLATAMEMLTIRTEMADPVVITQDGYAVLDNWEQDIAFTGDPKQTAQAVVASINDRTADSVIIQASATNQATIVNEIQGLTGFQQFPILLTPQALTSSFSHNVGLAADLKGVLVTAGQRTQDNLALQSGDQAEAISTFLQALRMTVDSHQPGLLGEEGSTQALIESDVRAHDAVVVLVRAAEQARADKKLTLASALENLALTTDDGIVCDTLDFTTQNMLYPRFVTPLYASSQDTGLRPLPQGQTTPLAWLSL